MRTLELAPPHLVHDVLGQRGSAEPVPGPLLRASFTARYSPEDVAVLRAYGVTAVLDLRSDREAGKLPQHLPARSGVSYRRIAIGDEASRPLPDNCATLSELYVRHLTAHGCAVAEAVAYVVEPRDGAVLVHCRTGRDRTGLVVALVLTLAGWDRRAVMAQHAEVVEAVAPVVARRRASWTAKGKDLAYFDAMNTGSVAALAHALDWIADRHGTVTRFLAAHGASPGLMSQAVQRLGSGRDPADTSSTPAPRRPHR
ncbi:tyrosine-protein phosphatase [Micromonospora auratinigra]|uniref:Protein-tyrosine phosphatase n=1 Tax=Micromonospora auratinigra TaxID=261654 RepID=A0A1A8Z5P2_9ACTN|nr:tyrosine-protein phosphatase [Micromonospora auratinigra]SBT39102.1 protein-tyrosine phosphatase [Micromonospora auratinigra]